MSGPRVLVLTKGLDIGGVERMVVDLARGLVARGTDVVVATLNGDRRRLEAPLVVGGIEVVHLGRKDSLGPVAMVAAVRALRAVVTAHEIDVVHAHGPLPTVIARLASKRVVSTAHTPWTGVHPVSQAAWRLTARRDSTTLAVSEGVRASLPASARSRTTVLHHGVDRDAAERARAAARRSPHATLALVTVASHRDVKNYPNLLRAVAHATARGSRLTLRAIGDGPNLAADQALASDLGLADIVTFEPPLDDVLSTIAAADVLVVASDYEGQPMVVREALAVGTPVVSTAVGLVAEVLADGAGVIVPVDDAVALGEALSRLAEGRAELATLRSATTAVTVRTLDDVIDDHLAVYTRVVSR